MSVNTTVSKPVCFFHDGPGKPTSLRKGELTPQLFLNSSRSIPAHLSICAKTIYTDVCKNNSLRGSSAFTKGDHIALFLGRLVDGQNSEDSVPTNLLQTIFDSQSTRLSQTRAASLYVPVITERRCETGYFHLHKTHDGHTSITFYTFEVSVKRNFLGKIVPLTVLIPEKDRVFQVLSITACSNTFLGPREADEIVVKVLPAKILPEHIKLPFSQLIPTHITAFTSPHYALTAVINIVATITGVPLVKDNDRYSLRYLYLTQSLAIKENFELLSTTNDIKVLSKNEKPLEYLPLSRSLFFSPHMTDSITKYLEIISLQQIFSGLFMNAHETISKTDFDGNLYVGILTQALFKAPRSNIPFEKLHEHVNEKIGQLHKVIECLPDYLEQHLRNSLFTESQKRTMETHVKQHPLFHIPYHIFALIDKQESLKDVTLPALFQALWKTIMELQFQSCSSSVAGTQNEFVHLSSNPEYYDLFLYGMIWFWPSVFQTMTQFLERAKTSLHRETAGDKHTWYLDTENDGIIEYIHYTNLFSDVQERVDTFREEGEDAESADTNSISFRANIKAFFAKLFEKTTVSPSLVTLLDKFCDEESLYSYIYEADDNSSSDAEDDEESNCDGSDSAVTHIQPSPEPVATDVPSFQLPASVPQLPLEKSSAGILSNKQNFPLQPPAPVQAVASSSAPIAPTSSQANLQSPIPSALLPAEAIYTPLVHGSATVQYSPDTIPSTLNCEITQQIPFHTDSAEFNFSQAHQIGTPYNPVMDTFGIQALLPPQIPASQFVRPYPQHSAQFNTALLSSPAPLQEALHTVPVPENFPYPQFTQGMPSDFATPIHMVALPPPHLVPAPETSSCAQQYIPPASVTVMPPAATCYIPDPALTTPTMQPIPLPTNPTPPHTDHYAHFPLAAGPPAGQPGTAVPTNPTPPRTATVHTLQPPPSSGGTTACVTRADLAAAAAAGPVKDLYDFFQVPEHDFMAAAPYSIDPFDGELYGHAFEGQPPLGDGTEDDDVSHRLKRRRLA